MSFDGQVLTYLVCMFSFHWKLFMCLKKIVRNFDIISREIITKKLADDIVTRLSVFESKAEELMLIKVSKVITLH